MSYRMFPVPLDRSDYPEITGKCWDDILPDFCELVKSGKYLTITIFYDNHKILDYRNYDVG